MGKLLKVTGNTATRFTETSMQEAGLKEAADLERWLAENIDIIAPDTMVISRQFNSWYSTEDSASERLDILALARSGEVVIVELKRDQDKKVHLQALTYAALASTFTYSQLAEVHAEWFNKEHPHSELKKTSESVLEEIQKFLDTPDDSFDENKELPAPRIILVAREFPNQVMTTILWLSTIAPNLQIECKTFDIYHYSTSSDGNAPTDATPSTDFIVSFNHLFPVVDFETRRLKPKVGVSTQDGRTKPTTEKRSRAVVRIRETAAIKNGAHIVYDPTKLISEDYVDKVNQWLEKNPNFLNITWSTEGKDSSPLYVAGSKEQYWSPGGLSNYILNNADPDGNEKRPGSYQATLYFLHDGQSLVEIADSL